MAIQGMEKREAMDMEEIETKEIETKETQEAKEIGIKNINIDLRIQDSHIESEQWTNRRQAFRDLMYRTEMARKRMVHPEWTKLGLIAGQPRVLIQLHHKEDVTQKELSDACCMEPATLSRALDKLEAMGYLIRKENPDSRRSFLVSLTSEGRKKTRQVKDIFTSLERQMLEGFTEAELETLLELMGRIYENLTEGEESL